MKQLELFDLYPNTLIEQQVEDSRAVLATMDKLYKEAMESDNMILTRTNSVTLKPSQVQYKSKKQRLRVDFSNDYRGEIVVDVIPPNHTGIITGIETGSVRGDLGYMDKPTEQDLRKTAQEILDDDSVMPFGKHQGKRLSEISDNYWEWFVDQDWSSKWPGLVQYAEDRLS